MNHKYYDLNYTNYSVAIPADNHRESRQFD